MTTLVLADVHRVTCPVAGAERDVFLFDHHRTAFTLWAQAARRRGPLTLLTLDRHMDLETPRAAAPRCDAPLEELDRFARFSLSPRNDDHVVAAMEAGALAGAAVVARSHEPRSIDAFRPWRDATGASHPCAFAPTLERAGPDLLALLDAAPAIALDVDLDCFTTRSDGHLDEVVPWDRALIEEFLLPPGFDWPRVLAKVELVTIAREPYHCGGFARAARLWADFAAVFFERLLRVPQP